MTKMTETAKLIAALKLLDARMHGRPLGASGKCVLIWVESPFKGIPETGDHLDGLWNSVELVANGFGWKLSQSEFGGARFERA